MTKKILTEISIGELLDKISILEIKNKNINDKFKLNHIKKEYKDELTLKELLGIIKKENKEYLVKVEQFESDQLSERTKTAMQYKKSKNERIGSIPYGKRLHKNGKDLLINHTEQEIIKLIFNLKKDGLSLNKIAAHLNRTKHKPRGVKWYMQTIRRVLAA